MRQAGGSQQGTHVWMDLGGDDSWMEEIRGGGVYPKGLAKLGNIVAETLLWRQMFTSLAARETLCCRKTNFAARKQKRFLPQVKNIFAYQTQMLHQKHIFSSLATMKTMFTSFSAAGGSIYGWWWRGKGKKERNWRDEEIELLITLYEDRACLWDLAHEAET